MVGKRIVANIATIFIPVRTPQWMPSAIEPAQYCWHVICISEAAGGSASCEAIGARETGGQWLQAEVVCIATDAKPGRSTDGHRSDAMVYDWQALDRQRLRTRFEGGASGVSAEDSRHKDRVQLQRRPQHGASPPAQLSHAPPVSPSPSLGSMGIGSRAMGLQRVPSVPLISGVAAMSLLALLSGAAAADALGQTSSINLTGTASLNTEDNICLQPGLLLADMCTMIIGRDLFKTYTSAVLLRGRGFGNASMAQGFTNAADVSMRPDLAVSATFKTVSAFSMIKATALVSVDMFLCSETTCNNAVDLTYVNVSGQVVDVDESLQASQLGFRLGVVPQTLLAVGIPLPEDGSPVVNQTVVLQINGTKLFPTSVKSVVRSQRMIDSSAVNPNNTEGYAVLGTRVVFEAFSNFLLGLPSLGFGAYAIDGVCTYLLYPNSAWYQEYIVTALTPCYGASANQTFVLSGLQSVGGGWCTYCDGDSTSVENKDTPCYATDFATCGDFASCLISEGVTYPRINLNISGWDLVVYNLTDELTCDYLGGQALYTHQWSTIMMEVLAAGRFGLPAGCDYGQGGVTTFGAGNALNYTDSGDIDPPAGTFSSYPCPAVGQVGLAAAAQQGGYAALAAALQDVWIVGGPGVVFSMLGYERATLWCINSSVAAVETWAAQLADTTATGAATSFNLVLRVPGWFSLFATNVAAAIGAWAGYSGVEDWIIAITTHTSAASRRRRTAGKVLAILLVMIITVLPLLIAMLTDLLANHGNRGRDVKTFAQQAFQAPGYGEYQVVAVAQIDLTAENSDLPLAMGIPFLFTLVGIGVAAVLLTEHKRDKKDRLSATAAGQPHETETAPVIGFDKPVSLSDHPSHSSMWHVVGS